MANNWRGRGRQLWLAAYGAGLLACAALAWVVRDAPVQPDTLGGLVRIDALVAFFALLAVAGGALLIGRGAAPGRVALATLALLVGYSTTHLLALVATTLLATLLLAHLATLWQRRLASARALVVLLAPGCLLLASAALRLRGGAWRYDAPAAGAAFDSLVFWFVLLAAVAGGITLLRDLNPLAPAWLYPLLRLYSLGPWNTGWSFATLLLGGAVALWCATEATRAAAATRVRWIVGIYGGVALAGAGLSSAAGVAACCYALLCALLLIFGLPDSEAQNAEQEIAITKEPVPGATPVRWPALALVALSGALPITAPFVALWLGVGAAMAGGVPLLSVSLWLAGLGAAFAMLRAIADEHALVQAPRGLLRRRVTAAALSVVLGVAAPAVLAWPIVPVARQLGGGLTPYGDLAIWPWVGLAALDAARQPVASLPSAALGGLMLVLCSLAWLFALLRGTRHQ